MGEKDAKRAKTTAEALAETPRRRAAGLAEHSAMQVDAQVSPGQGHHGHCDDDDDDDDDDDNNNNNGKKGSGDKDSKERKGGCCSDKASVGQKWCGVSHPARGRVAADVLVARRKHHPVV